MQQQRPCSNELQLCDRDCLLPDCTRGICWTCKPGRRTPCQWTATEESQWSAEQEQGKRPLRHDSDVNDHDMHNSGHVNNQSKCTVWHCAYLSLLHTSIVHHSNGEHSVVAQRRARHQHNQELHLRNLHSLCTDSTVRNCLCVNRNIHALSMNRDIDPLCATTGMKRTLITPRPCLSGPYWL